MDRPAQYAHYPDDCEFNKLIRDNVPARLEAFGLVAETEIIEDDKDYRFWLGSKMMEEALEVFHAMDSVEDLYEELSDVLEVVRAVAAYHGIDLDELQGYCDAKREDKGGFEGRVFLIKTSKGEG